MKSIIVFFTLVALLSCEKIEIEGGTLAVNVTIGPLCPVEPCKKTDSEIKTIYESYSLVLTDAVSGTLVQEKNLSYVGTKGYFGLTALEPGNYKLNVKPENIFSKKGFPKDILIESGKTTTVDVSIDTGIR